MIRVEIGQSIKLSKFELEMARMLGQARYEAARRAGVADKRVGTQDNEHTDWLGMAGELAFCKLFNVYPDLWIIENGQEVGDRPDAVIDNRIMVDVKTTDLQNGRLLCAAYKKAVCDYFALMIADLPYLRFAGFMARGQLMVPERLKDLGHGKGYVAEQADLRAL